MKRKLQLTLESLAVESFETTAAGAARRGTVLGHQLCPMSQSTCIQVVCTCNPTDMSCNTGGTGGGGTTGPQSVYETCPARTECSTDFC